MAKMKGFDGAIKDLRQLGADGDRYVKAIVQSTADQLVLDAKQNAPANTGKLRQSIGKEKTNDDFTATAFVGEQYGAFIEFGTGGYVQVPPELAEEAMEFKGFKSGNFDDFLQAIQDWCRNKGIPEEAAYPICISILRNGIKPHPYFYPAYTKARDSVPAKLQAALNKLKL